MSRYAIDTIHGVVCSKQLCFLSPLEYNANPVKSVFYSLIFYQILYLAVVYYQASLQTVVLLIADSLYLRHQEEYLGWFDISHFLCTCKPGAILQWHNVPIACHHMYIEHTVPVV